jgi:hypothetical protein
LLGALIVIEAITVAVIGTGGCRDGKVQLRQLYGPMPNDHPILAPSSRERPSLERSRHGSHDTNVVYAPSHFRAGQLRPHGKTSRIALVIGLVRARSVDCFLPVQAGCGIGNIQHRRDGLQGAFENGPIRRRCPRSEQRWRCVGVVGAKPMSPALVQHSKLQSLDPCQVSSVHTHDQYHSSIVPQVPYRDGCRRCRAITGAHNCRYSDTGSLPSDQSHPSAARRYITERDTRVRAPIVCQRGHFSTRN